MATPLSRHLADMSAEGEARGFVFWFLELIALGCVLVAVEGRFPHGEITHGIRWLAAGLLIGLVGFYWPKIKATLPRIIIVWPSQLGSRAGHSQHGAKLDIRFSQDGPYRWTHGCTFIRFGVYNDSAVAAENVEVFLTTIQPKPAWESFHPDLPYRV